MTTRRRFILENGDEQELVVVEHVDGDEYRDVAFLSTREGWAFEQVQAMAREIRAVPALLEALRAMRTQVGSLVEFNGLGGVTLSPMVLATFQQCVTMADDAIRKATEE
jgi:hypothetical protein